MESLLIPQRSASIPALSFLETRRFKTEYLSISAVRPIRAEEVPLTSLLLSVLRRGTERYPSLQAINRRLDGLFGTELSIRNFYRGDYQVVGFSLDFLNAAHLPDGVFPLREALDVICQIFFHPLLDENGLLLASYVEDEKRYQQSIIRSIKNNPSGYASDRCQALFYGDKPCGAPIYGRVEDLEKVTPELLTAHWKKVVSEFSPECFFVGSLPQDEVEDALQKTLFCELGDRAFQKPLCSFSPVQARTAEAYEESFPANQSHLAIALATGTILGDSDYYAMQVYNELLLGVSPVSKLFLNLREKQSLCYSCASYYRPFNGAIFLRIGLAASCRERAENEIRRQMEELAKGHISAFELEAAKRSLATSFLAIEDSPEALENYFFGRTLAGLSIPLAESREKILSVTREDVIRAAGKVVWTTAFFLAETPGEEGTFDENDESDL